MDFFDDAPVLRSVAVSPPPLTLRRAADSSTKSSSHFNEDAVFSFPKKSSGGSNLRLEVSGKHGSSSALSVTSTLVALPLPDGFGLLSKYECDVNTSVRIAKQVSVNTIASTLEAALTSNSNALSCDFSFNETKCKWKIMCTANISYTKIKARVWQDTDGSHIVEFQRRMGDCMTFRRVFDACQLPLLSLSSASPSASTTTTTTSSASVPLHMHNSSLQQELAELLDVDAVIAPLISMAHSKQVEQFIISAEAAAKLCESGGQQARHKLASSELPSLLVEMVVADLSRTQSVALPLNVDYSQSVIRSVMSALACLSEDKACHSDLMKSGAVSMCWNYVKGKVCMADEGAVDYTEVESAREAARCLANIVSSSGSGAFDLLAKEVSDADRKDFVGCAPALTDERLRVQAKRVAGRLVSV